jgi:hypothetical protein
MKLQNVTMVVLSSDGLSVRDVIENPTVATGNGKPVIGPLAQRLLTVKEIMAKNPGMSKNQAQEQRRANPLLWSVPFERAA